jgi:transaldolase
MRPKGLRTRIFLDGGDPEETRKLIRLLGFLDGQTTNPTLISKNPQARKRMAGGGTFSSEEVLAFYREVVREISGLLPEGSVSVEVYADAKTRTDSMLTQGSEMFQWIPNAHVKFPTSRNGLQAARQAVQGGMRVNMTLVFSQAQAAAVYAATSGAKRGDVFLSPFVGRLDDRGENGMDLIANIIEMYGRGDGHVEVLTASVRKLDHLFRALQLDTDIITAPYDVLREWGESGMPLPDHNYRYEAKGLAPIQGKDLSLDREWTSYDIRHELTDKGMAKFSNDWNALIQRAA